MLRRESHWIIVCRDICYERLQKFQQAAKELSEVKKEIEEAFNSRQRPRAKRLTTKEAATTYPAAKASKSLGFGAANTCTSSIPRAQFHGLVSPPVEKEHRRFDAARRSQHVRHVAAIPPVPEEFRPGLTSTPVSWFRNESSSQVKLSVKYPSKNVNKVLRGAYQGIGKALAHGVASRIAGAVMNCASVSKHIIAKVMKLVSREAHSLCSRKNPSLLRKTGKEELENFDLEEVCSEWRERAPLFYSFLLTSATNKTTTNFAWFGSLAVAGSVLLRQRNPHMCATAAVIGILLKSKSIEVMGNVYVFLCCCFACWPIFWGKGGWKGLL